MVPDPEFEFALNVLLLERLLPLRALQEDAPSIVETRVTVFSLKDHFIETVSECQGPEFSEPR